MSDEHGVDPTGKKTATAVAVQQKFVAIKIASSSFIFAIKLQWSTFDNPKDSTLSLFLFSIFRNVPWRF